MRPVSRRDQRAIAGLAIVIGVGTFAVLRPRDACGCGSKRDVAQLAVTRFAREGYPTWALHQIAYPCPRSLRELAPETPRELLDPWGTPYVFACHARGITVTSAGADRTFGTDDDIRSAQ